MEVYGIIGNPIGHALSPPMQQAAFDDVGLDAKYVAFEPAADAAVEAVEAADALGVSGLNVTSPFKRAVLGAVDPEPLAERIGAVNTIEYADGRAVGYNTDAVGAVDALRHNGVETEGTAVVVGAGGAGRAVAFGLADEGMRVSIANRTVETARELAEEVPGATAHGLDELADLVADADVLAHCTSVGMNEDESIVPAEALHSDLAVMDAVYTPKETRLLGDAADAGATTVAGAQMLLYQGIAAFELWTGETAPLEPMHDALLAWLSES